MKVIGITGGVGNGKSSVMEYLVKNYDALAVQADEVAHNLMLPGGGCYKELIRLIGQGYTDEVGNIDRKKLADILFKDDEIRAKINGIIHPAVKKYIIKQIEKERKYGTKYFFVEAALLIEDNYDEICDEMWYIYADEKVREERLIKDRGYSREKVRAIMDSQLTDEIFDANTDFTIDNSDGFELTIKQLDKRMKNL